MMTPTTPYDITAIPGLDSYRCIAQALDPIHIGTGGERLSRVDLAIVRDPATKLPKLPGTSLSGACRSHAALRYQRLSCAGQGESGSTHCGNCEICKTFGYAKGSANARGSTSDSASGSKGLAIFSDAQIVAFPVATSIGPLWIASPQSLGTTLDIPPNEVHVVLKSGRKKAPNSRIAVGWLALHYQEATLPPHSPQLLETLDVGIVSDGIFSRIVNDNLEVRTSVSINPLTGAAATGALFTYEAIPMGTIFAFDVQITPARDESTVGDPPAKVVENGLALIEYIGVGGMTTRGMGRMRVTMTKKGAAS